MVEQWLTYHWFDGRFGIRILLRMVSLPVMVSPCAQLYNHAIKIIRRNLDRVHSHRVVPIDGVITCSRICLRNFTNINNRHLFKSFHTLSL